MQRVRQANLIISNSSTLNKGNLIVDLKHNRGWGVILIEILCDCYVILFRVYWSPLMTCGSRRTILVACLIGVL